jgi:GH24 family phage-related lysozyme (muramidase)
VNCELFHGSKTMKLSAAGMELLKKSEGFRDHIYLDIAGLPTIGYGHRLLNSQSFPGGISEADAAIILAVDVRDAEQAVERLVTVELSQGQFDALVDFTFNLGVGRLAKSTLLKLLNKGRYDDASVLLLRWDHAGCTEVPALKARREAECELWRGSSS